MADKESPQDWVHMVHPKLKAPPARVRRSAFDQVHAPRGFKLATEKQVADAAAQQVAAAVQPTSEGE